MHQWIHLWWDDDMDVYVSGDEWVATRIITFMFRYLSFFHEVDIQLSTGLD